MYRLCINRAADVIWFVTFYYATERKRATSDSVNEIIPTNFAISDWPGARISKRLRIHTRVCIDTIDEKIFFYRE